MIDELMEAIIKTLPHGSGIDWEWEYEIKPGGIHFKNSFHLMNECGMYDGYQDFTVKFYFDNRPFNITFQKPIRKTNSAYGLKEYLEETFSQWEEDFEKLLEKFDSMFYANIQNVEEADITPIPINIEESHLAQETWVIEGSPHGPFEFRETAEMVCERFGIDAKLIKRKLQ